MKPVTGAASTELFHTHAVKGFSNPLLGIWKSDSNRLRNHGTGEQSDPILPPLGGVGGQLHIPETSADTGELPDVPPALSAAPLSVWGDQKLGPE